MSEIKTINHKGEPRVDSRIIAEQMSVQHKSLLELMGKYRSKFERWGNFAFQTRKSKSGAGRPTRYALLNEDQAYFLLTLVNNSEVTVELKANLVSAFKLARDGQAIDAQYLPFYHSLHDEVKHLYCIAKENGSTAPERFYHININRLINKTFGLSSGERPTLTPEQRALVTSANVLVRKKLVEASRAGLNHKEAYQGAKQALTAYSAALLPTTPAIERKGGHTV